MPIRLVPQPDSRFIGKNFFTQNRATDTRSAAFSIHLILLLLPCTVERKAASGHALKVGKRSGGTVAQLIRRPYLASSTLVSDEYQNVPKVEVWMHARAPKCKECAVLPKVLI